MSTATNKAIVSRFTEQMWNNGRLDLAEEFLAEDVVEHGIPQIPGLNGRDTSKAIIDGLRKSLPDIQFTLHEVVAEEDKVVTYWTMKGTHLGELLGVPATGKQTHQRRGNPLPAGRRQNCRNPELHRSPERDAAVGPCPNARSSLNDQTCAAKSPPDRRFFQQLHHRLSEY